MSDVLILGASARAAIHSARRAGLTPHAIDLFADRDATAYATVLECDLADYPDGLERLADTFEPMPWLFTGGLENHPDLVDRIAAKRPLLGNAGDVLRMVRGKAGLRRLLKVMPPMPRVVVKHSGDPSVRWVRKSFGSSGGMGVTWATDLAPRAGTYLQEFVPGTCYSAALATKGNTVSLLGVTEQLVGTEWLHAKPFQYAGSLGPVWPTDSFHEELMMDCPSATSVGVNVQGPWGLDLIARDGTPLLIDFNPRYTASMELIEHSTGRSVFDGKKMRGKGSEDIFGKAVYYAPHALRFPEVTAIERAIAVAADPWALPEYADIPAVGGVIDAGQPVLSFFERAADAEACRAALKRRAAELDALLARHRVGVSP